MALVECAKLCPLCKQGIVNLFSLQRQNVKQQKDSRSKMSDDKFLGKSELTVFTSQTKCKKNRKIRSKISDDKFLGKSELTVFTSQLKCKKTQKD